MTNWIKRHWILLVIGLVILYLSYGAIDGAIAKYKYKKQIKTLDTDISGLKQGIKDSKGREETWKKSSQDNWTLAMEKEAKLRKKDKEMAVKIQEKRELKKKIKAMPITQVVVRTIEIINCPEVTQQEQGIVFTLDCAKSNLTVLEASFSLKGEVDDWTEKYNTSQGEVVDLKNVIVGKDGEIKEITDQSVKKDGIAAKWEGKFNLSEKRGKRSWWKGLKTGAAVGGVIAFFAGFFLGK